MLVFAGVFSAVFVIQASQVQAITILLLELIDGPSAQWFSRPSPQPQPNSLLSDFLPALFDSLVNAPASRSVSL
ncbi:hypothetical protein ARMGADRAFT_1091910 [Armillaria gallica]|uniref:Secreted protein n=1 Tax=Armillaria gallica TaxID=47427 RepID=A0A2H3CCE9_ARMGA|nr:hypothetical protein ARMGADRAFT_1091910 [Armillaria gallica]